MQTRSPDELAALLLWPSRRNCSWDCPWPSYCLECHEAAYGAMWTARVIVVALTCRVTIETARASIVTAQKAERIEREMTMRSLAALPGRV